MKTLLTCIIAIALSVFALRRIGIIWDRNFGRTAHENQRLANYHPSEQIQRMTVATTMTEYGKRIFYLGNPLVTADKKTINSICSDHDNKAFGILGCYQRQSEAIYILEMPDPRLQGLMNTTVAHEMLHAGYDRLDKEERNKVNVMLEDVRGGLSGKEIAIKLSSYKTDDEGILLNELHSIVGTEIADLPPELENYYARYFADRKKIVALSRIHKIEFKNKESEIKVYDGELVTLNARIQEENARIFGREKEINTWRSALDVYRRDGNVRAYDQLVPQVNEKIKEYNEAVNQNRETIRQYNAVVKLRNSIVEESQRMAEMMDSRKESPSI